MVLYFFRIHVLIVHTCNIFFVNQFPPKNVFNNIDAPFLRLKFFFLHRNTSVTFAAFVRVRVCLCVCASRFVVDGHGRRAGGGG